MQAKRIVIIGLGGQGNLLVTRLLGEAALTKDIPTMVSEIHGMAQRGGIVESTVVMGDLNSPIVAEGETDILIGFEPLETLRAVGKARKDGVILTNTASISPFTVSMGQGVYPKIQDILQQLQNKVQQLFSMNAQELAKTAGNLQSLNMVFLGSLIGLEQLPITVQDMKDTIAQHIKKSLLDVNLSAFELGRQQTQNI